MSEKISKSEVVRDLLEKDPSLKPMDIVKIMGEKGIEITNRYVSIIKNKVKNSKGEKKISAAKRRFNSNREHDSNINDILAVKSLYESIGAERIISAVNALEQIVG